MLNQIGAPTAEPLEFSGRPGPAVSVRGVGHSFDRLRALEGVDAQVDGGAVLGIVGPSGCGKSTLLEIVCGLREPSDGSVLVGVAREPERRLASCAYMPQRDLLLPWLSAIDNAALALRIAGESKSASPTTSSAWGWPASRTPAPRSCPAACASGSPSCAR